LAENEITSFQEILKLKKMPALLEINVSNNSLDVEDPKKELVLHWRYLSKINEENVTQQDREEAEILLVERLEE
jgi:hypothetical protein